MAPSPVCGCCVSVPGADKPASPPELSPLSPSRGAIASPTGEESEALGERLGSAYVRRVRWRKTGKTWTWVLSASSPGAVTAGRGRRGVREQEAGRAPQCLGRPGPLPGQEGFLEDEGGCQGSPEALWPLVFCLVRGARVQQPRGPARGPDGAVEACALTRGWRGGPGCRPALCSRSAEAATQQRGSRAGARWCNSVLC